MKFYLLIAGASYYPQSGTSDWIGAFSSYEDAEVQVEKLVNHTYYQSGKKKGQIQFTECFYKINDNVYDWFEIVDLKEWINR